MNKEQFLLLLKLKNASLFKKKYIYLNLTSSIIPFVNFLYLENIIQSFCLFDKNIIINLRSFFDVDPLSTIKIVFSPSFTNSLTCKEISRLNSKKTLIIFSTDKGLKNILDCKRLKIGGKPLFII
jgi:ribosomal protein S8